jgi:hypothetical protein
VRIVRRPPLLFREAFGVHTRPRAVFASLYSVFALFGSLFSRQILKREMTMSAINRMLLFFWAVWLSIVAATNVLNGLQVLTVLPESFRFVSGNWQAINHVMDPLRVPSGLQAFLFVSVIGWETLAAVLYWWATATYGGRPLAREKPTLCACSVNLDLWAAFQILDEVFVAYQLEDVHRLIFLVQLGTLLRLQLSPNAAPTQRP